MADGTKAIVDTSETDGAATEAAPTTGAEREAGSDHGSDRGSERGRAAKGPAKGSPNGSTSGSANGSPNGSANGSAKAARNGAKSTGRSNGKGTAKADPKTTPLRAARPKPAPAPAPAPAAANAPRPRRAPAAPAAPVPDAPAAPVPDAPDTPVPDAAGDGASGLPPEVTAPLSAQEIDAELAAQGARPDRPSRSRGVRRPLPPVEPSEPAPATSTETLDADTATLPTVLPAPKRHSGDKIGARYRLEECISESETFTSWRAVDEKLRRAVGVHLLAAGHRRAKSVLTAARSAALLGDPRFVQVLDAVQEGELVYVIREWLPGARDLGGLLSDGPMEPYDAYQMVRQVTDAIAAAHERGQAHLRLTPKCVLRTDGGQYRINGIAVDAALRGLPAEDAELTDVRAIGALLYAALTHRWPYPEDRYDLQGLPKGLGCVPPDQVRAGVHKGLAELAARILCEQPPNHKEPITSPAELAAAIGRMPRIRQPEQPAPPALRALPAARPRYASTAQTQVIPRTEPAPAPAPAPHPRTRRGLRRLLKWTASLVALSAVAVGSWQLAQYVNARQDKPDSSQTAPAPAPSGSAPAAATGEKIAITTLSPFNAFGDNKSEHFSELPNATDGNPATAWTTQRYNDQFGAYRPGTGLLIDLGSARRVGSVDVQFLGDTKAELKAAPTGTTTQPSSDEAGFRSFGASIAADSGSKVTLKPGSPVTTRYLLLWLTGVPVGDDGGFRGKVAEVQVNG
ncbi:serine/threonine protein kinase [Kitasatospora sp. NA04385]|uniref:protein kinase family protein n=1 Tax=Kitasatospora sp. NA04385 TaxID=2742135 RepID=UPI0015925134|nr:protein kinase family protein [Kitasatospora sp. NA04385]QKW20759.1 serine/threonine protein kinase [Kitasatospora sp. NA04385]